MKKLLIGVIGLVVIIAATLLVGPGLIDWNRYKTEITEIAKAKTGRDLQILGDIKITLLPSPSLSVRDVRLANIEGAAAADMVRLKSLEIKIALMPLLGGTVRIETVRLVEPVIELEVLGDGRKNWVFAPGEGQIDDGAQTEADTPAAPQAAAPQAAVPQAAAPEAPEKGGGLFSAVQIDSFAIENGTLVFRDRAAGRIEKIENLNARFSAASLRGPVDSAGSAVVRGLPLSFDISVGEIIQGRTMPFVADITLIPGEVKSRFNGAVINLDTSPGVRGSLRLDGGDFAGFLAGLSGNAGLPDFLKRPFSFEAAVNVSKKAAEIGDIVLSLDGLRATGGAKARFGGETIEAEVDLAVNRLDLDSLLTPPAPPPTSPEAEAAPATGGGTPKTSLRLQPAKPAPPPPGDGAKRFALPGNINATLNVSVEAMTYRRALIRQARFSAELANGEITISQLSALLPGGSEFAVFGFVATPGGAPQFEGNIELASSDLRGTLKWFGIEIPAAVKRMRNLSFASKVVATSRRLVLSETKLKFDSSQITGGGSLTLGRRPLVQAELTLDRLNLDGYLTPGAKTKPPESESRSAASPDAASPDAVLPDAGPLAALAALSGFDADIKARVKSLTYLGQAAKDLRLEGALRQGKLTLRRASIGGLAGMSAKLSGSVVGLGGLGGPSGGPGGPGGPALAGVSFDFKARDLKRLFKLIGAKPPPFLAKLGAVTVSGKLDGTTNALDLTVDLTAAKGKFGFAGKVVAAAAKPVIDGALRVSHPDIAALLRRVGIKYRPARKPGKFSATGTIRGTAEKFEISGLKATLGKTNFSGLIGADLSGARPGFTLDLVTGAIKIDDFLPLKSTARLGRRPRVIPAIWRGLGPGGAAPGPIRISADAGVDKRWSRTPIDFSALRTFDAGVKLRSRALSFGEFVIDAARLDLTLADGALSLRAFEGTLFGGKFSASARLSAAGPRPRMSAKLSLKGLDLARLDRATGGNSVRAGQAHLTADLRTAGASQAQMIAALGGTGSIALQGLDPKSGASRNPILSSVIGLLAGLDKFASAFGGGRAKAKGLADITANFRMNNGVARFEDLKLASKIGLGSARGSVDLARWLIDVDGEIRLAPNLLTSLIIGGKTAPSIPFSLKGRLDKPKTKIETGKLLGGGIAIPGLERLRGKSGIGGLIDQLLPGLILPRAPTPAPSDGGGPPPPPPPDQPPPKPRLDDVIKGILRGLGR